MPLYGANSPLNESNGELATDNETVVFIFAQFFFVFSPFFPPPSSQDYATKAEIGLELLYIYILFIYGSEDLIVQELCESRGGRPGLSS